jgi:flagellar hook-length control protein FliK
LIHLINLTKILGNSEKIQDVLSQINKNSQNGESFEKILQRVIEELSKSEVESNPINESSTQKSANGLPKQDVKRSEEALKNTDGLSERKVKEITAGDGIERGLDNVKGELKGAEIEKENFKLLNKTQLMTKHEEDKPLDSLKPAEAIVEASYDDSKKSTQDYGDTTLTVTENAEVIRGTQENNESLVHNKENKETASELKQKFIEEFSPKVPKENEKKITVVDATVKIQNNNGKENAIVHDGTEYLSNLQKMFSTENALVEPTMVSNKQEQTTKPNSSLQPNQPDQSTRTSKSTGELTGKRQVSQLSEQSPNSKTYNEWRTSSQSQVSRAFQDVKSYQAPQSKQPQQVIENTAEAKGNNANNVPNTSKDGNKTLNIHQNFGVENESMETKNVLKGLAFQSSSSGMVVNNPQNIPGANIQKDSLRSKDKFVDAGTEEREKREVGISNRVTTIVTTNKDNFRTDLSDKSQILHALTVEISRIIQKQQAVSASLSNVDPVSSEKNNSSQAVIVTDSRISKSDSLKNVVNAGQKALSFHQIVQVQTEQKKNFTFQIQADIPLTVVEKGYSERKQKVSSQEALSFPVVQTNSQKVLNDNNSKNSSNKSVDDNILQMINSIKVITSEHIRTIGDLENKNEKAPVVETVNSADPKLTNGQMIFAAELAKNIAAEKPKIHHNQNMENIESIDSENPLKVEDKTLITNVFQPKIEKDVVEQVHSNWQSGSRDTEGLAKEEYDAREFRNEIAQASKNKLEIKSFEIEYKMKEESKKEEFQERPNISNKFLERLAELTYKSSEAKTEQTYQTNNRFELVERLQHSQNLEEIYKKIRDFGFSNRLEENVRMKLYPEQLGNIDVELRKEGKAINIVFVAENEKSKELLEKNIGILRDRLTALDFDVRNMEVKMKEEINYHEDARHHQNQQNQKHGEQNHEDKRKAFSEEVMEDDNERERND